MYVHQINFRTVFETKYKKTQFSEKKSVEHYVQTEVWEKVQLFSFKISNMQVSKTRVK